MSILHSWKCSHEEKVITISCFQFGDGEMETLNLIDSELKNATLLILTNITRLPPELSQYFDKKHPLFEIHYSKTNREYYYMNTCSRCHAHFGDYFLHSEPSGSFFPMSKKKASTIMTEDLPINKNVEIEASDTIESGDIILNGSTKKYFNSQSVSLNRNSPGRKNFTTKFLYPYCNSYPTTTFHRYFNIT